MVTAWGSQMPGSLQISMWILGFFWKKSMPTKKILQHLMNMLFFRNIFDSESESESSSSSSSSSSSPSSSSSSSSSPDLKGCVDCFFRFVLWDILNLRSSLAVSPSFAWKSAQDARLLDAEKKLEQLAKGIGAQEPKTGWLEEMEWVKHVDVEINYWLMGKHGKLTWIQQTMQVFGRGT